MTARDARRVRAAESADLAALAAIHATAFPRPWSEASLAEELGRGDRLWLLAEVDGDVVAAGGAANLAGEAHVLSVAVVEGRRREGHASAIVAALLERCVERFGVERATLEVRESNHAARALYRRCGFAEVGVRPGYYQDDGEGAVVLWCDDVTTALDGLSHGRSPYRPAQEHQTQEDPA